MNEVSVFNDEKSNNNVLEKDQKMKKHEEKCKLNCDGETIIRHNSGKGFIIKVGTHHPPYIKELLGIPEEQTLMQVMDKGDLKSYDDKDKVHIEGCEKFIGGPKCASNSSPELDDVIEKAPFEETLGCKPIVSREAGNHLLLFEKVPLGTDGKDVSMLLEWPSVSNRLLFSEQIPTPKNPDPKWAYPNVMIGGRTWQGISMRTTESMPFEALLSYLRHIVW